MVRIRWRNRANWSALGRLVSLVASVGLAWHMAHRQSGVNARPVEPLGDPANRPSPGLVPLLRDRPTVRSAGVEEVLLHDGDQRAAGTGGGLPPRWPAMSVDELLKTRVINNTTGKLGKKLGHSFGSCISTKKSTKF